jgi:hypothetical protein
MGILKIMQAMVMKKACRRAEERPRKTADSSWVSRLHAMQWEITHIIAHAIYSEKH